MSDIIEITPNAAGMDNRVCRVSYTLNNDQPVISTIIGDQPLFYMDYEVDYEDEEIFDAADLNFLENEIKTLQKEIGALERFSENFAHDPEKCLTQFAENVESIDAEEKETSSIKNLKDILGRSRLAQSYLAFADQHGVEMRFSTQVQDASYNRNTKLILINANLDQTDQVLLAARELRRHFQHRAGALINPLLFHPDSAILVNRMQNADLAVSIIRVAWELQLSDYKDGWERVENSSFADLGRAFAREAFLDFRTINNGQAMAAVLESWFLSERCRAEDKKLVHLMLADHKGYVFDLEQSEKSITPALIAALGEMPFGKNYLSGHVETIMNDPIFTDVRDRSNANFLWFVKFERSFRETEQELQSTSDIEAEDIRQTAYLRQYQGLDDEQTGQVVQLFSNEEPSEPKQGRGLLSKQSKPSGQSAEIIYLRRWSGE